MCVASTQRNEDVGESERIEMVRLWSQSETVRGGRARRRDGGHVGRRKLRLDLAGRKSPWDLCMWWKQNMGKKKLQNRVVTLVLFFLMYQTSEQADSLFTTAAQKNEYLTGV